jgi:hypothetical protein
MVGVNRRHIWEIAMSTALRIAHGAFGRVALLDMDWSLVRHAHPHCHVLLKVEGADTQFVVGDTVYPLTNETAVLVNGWQPHCYVHDPKKPHTIILARCWRCESAHGRLADLCRRVPYPSEGRLGSERHG